MNIHLSLDEAVIKTVKQRAVEEGCSVSSLVEACLRSYLGLPVHQQPSQESPQEPTMSMMPAETQAWLDTDLSRLDEVEPYDWGDADPTTLGEPLFYEAEKGWTVGSERRHASSW